MALIDKEGNVNQKALSNSIQKQQRVFSQIDASMAILEKLPMLSDSVYGIINANTFNYSASPLGFLFELLKVLGVTETEIREWIVEILVYTLPTVEIGLKGLLLSNLKSLVSCNADVRIPFYMRKKVDDIIHQTIFQENFDRGILIPKNTIDPEGLLDLSPFTEPGMLKYFGCITDKQYDEAVEKTMAKYGYTSGEFDSDLSSSSRIAKLTRADDFNAFLWYVMHKGSKQNPIGVVLDYDGEKTTFEFDNITYKLENGINLRGVTKITCETDSSLKDGATLYETHDPNQKPLLEYPGISIVIDSSKDGEGNVTGHTLVELSSDWESCNWYVDKSNYYKSNLGLKRKTSKDYENERAICNVRYIDQKNLPKNMRGRGLKDNFILTVLPKPLLVLPRLTLEKDSDKKLNVHIQSKVLRILFDKDGNPTSKGRYSLNCEKMTDYEHVDKDKSTVTVDDVTVKINYKTGAYELADKNDASKLVECYQGITVYEFNYDYVMGMKLFDPKVVCQKILENTLNPNYNVNFSLTLNKQKNKVETDNVESPFFNIRQRMLETVYEVLSEDEDEINDCFFTFSNEQYEEMIKASDNIRYHKASYTDGYGGAIDMSEVNNILSSYSSDATLEEQKDIISRTLKAATATINGGYFEGGFDTNNSQGGTNTNDVSSGNSTDFMTQLLQQLILAIVDALLSPKVLMLLMVNEELMRDDNDKATITTEDLMKMMKDVVKSLIKEVRDMIMKKILDYIVKSLTPIMLQIQAAIASEQMQAYLAIVKMLLGWLNKGLTTAMGLAAITDSLLKTFSGNKNVSDLLSNGLSDIEIPTILDNITYADIYPQDTPDASPIIEKC